MSKYKKIAFIFPGQGAQYVGMAKDVCEAFPIAKQTFEEADDILGRNLSSLVFHGPENILTETKNSQVAIYVTSVALLRAFQSLYPQVLPNACAGLSLGEYTALHAAGKLGFVDCLKLVQYRGQYMNDACESTHGTMAVILGLDPETVEKLVADLAMPNDLWAANFNCPGQVVISGTLRGIEAGIAEAKVRGAKRTLPLQVHGAFHSGLMKSAEEKLSDHVHAAPLSISKIDLAMNVTGDYASDIKEIKSNLIKQVTHPVYWEKCVHRLSNAGVDLFIEIGCKKTLSEFNKRIKLDIPTPTLNIEKLTDLQLMEKELS
jgi:[acyl-carrier-protein] S-malonyltransferase